ncbi:MAG: methylisocitrate lyase [Nitrospirae bacterium]|nr:MAG: methylisocitrate lyase [Nitrospirota bacterium]
MTASGLSSLTAFRNRVRTTTLAVPGVFNAFSARLVERAGFEAAYISGAGISAARALPDIGLLTMTEMAMETKQIAQAVDIPVFVDADTGYGEIHQVYRAVREFALVGAAGIQLEDQATTKRCGHLPGKVLIEKAAMCRKIAAAVEAKRDRDFLVIARTDARANEGLAGAIDRAKAYRAAGADAVFPEALESAEEFAQFAAALRDPTLILIANMTEWGKTPYLSVKDFAQLGYHLVLFPMTLFRMAARVMEEALQELVSQGTQRNLLERMQARQTLYEILRYQAYDEFEKRLHERQVSHEHERRE